MWFVPPIFDEYIVASKDFGDGDYDGLPIFYEDEYGFVLEYNSCEKDGGCFNGEE